MLNRARAAIAAAALTLGFGGPSLAQVAPPAAPAAAVVPAQALIDGWLEEINAAGDLVGRYTGLDVNGDTVVMHGFVVIDTATRNGVQIDTLTLRGYREQGETGFAFDEMLIDRLQGRVDDTAVQIVNVEIENLNVPATGFAFDPARPVGSILEMLGLVANSSFDEMRIGRMDIAEASQGMNTLTTYHNYVMHGIAGGRIETISAGPMVVEAPSPDGLLMVTVAEVESRDTDLNAFIHVFDDAQYVGGVGDPDWVTFSGAETWRNILVDAPGLQMRIRAVEMEDFRMRQSDTPIGALLDRLAAGADTMDEREAQAMTETIIVDLLMPYEIGRFAVEGIDLYTYDLDRFHLGEIHITNLSTDGLGEFGLSDLDVVAGGAASFRLGQLALGDIQFPSRDVLRDALAAAAAGRDVDAVPLVPTIGYFDVAGVEYGGNGTLPITLDRFQIRADGYVGPIPTNYAIELTGLGAPLTLLSEDIRRVLGQLGYTEATADFTLDISWNEATETLLLRNLYLSLAGAGSIRANVEISGFSRAMFENPELAAELGTANLRFVHGEFFVVDETVADRLFAWTAEGTGTPAAQYRDEFIRGLPFLLSVMMDRNVAAAIAPALQEFLRTPGTLSIVAAPAEPVPFDDLTAAADRDPMALLTLLGVTITATPP